MPLNRLSFGTARLGSPGSKTAAGAKGSGAKGAGAKSHGAADVHAAHLLQAAYELGIRAIDTGPDDEGAEQYVGAFLSEHDLHEEIAVATKLPALATAETGRIEQRVEECLVASLRHLRSEVVDSCLIHDVGDLTRHGQALVDALSRQIEKGRVLAIGLVAGAPADLAVLEDYPELGIVQHPFNLFDRRLLEAGWLGRLAASGVRLQLTRPLFDGLIGTAPDGLASGREPARAVLIELEDILAEFGLEALDAALPFVFSVDPDAVVVTADTREQLERLAASLERALPVELQAAIAHRLTDTPAEVVDGRPRHD